MSEKTVQISVRVSPEVRDLFKASVSYRHSTTQEVLSEAIEDYIESCGIIGKDEAMAKVLELDTAKKSGHASA